MDSIFTDDFSSIEEKLEYDKIWNKTKDYLDSNFKTEVKIKINFLQRVWEMQCCNLLLEKNFKIKSREEFKKLSIPKNEGPDFILEDNTYIECIVPKKGTNEFAIPEIKKDEVFGCPVDKIILRITHAIEEKANKQYSKWNTKKWFDKKAPFIILLDTKNLWPIYGCCQLPFVIQALFGFGTPGVNINTNELFYPLKNKIKKKEIFIETTLFLNDKIKHVSGIIFPIEGEFSFVNNPFSKNPVDDKFFEKFRSYKAEVYNNSVNLKLL